MNSSNVLSTRDGGGCCGGEELDDTHPYCVVAGGLLGSGSLLSSQRKSVDELHNNITTDITLTGMWTPRCEETLDAIVKLQSWRLEEASLHYIRGFLTILSHQYFECGIDRGSLRD